MEIIILLSNYVQMIINHSALTLWLDKKILTARGFQQFTTEINQHLELCNGSLLSIIKSTVSYHDHPKFRFCLKENLPHFLCVKGITGLVWREGSKIKQKETDPIYSTGVIYRQIPSHLLTLCFWKMTQKTKNIIVIWRYVNN